MMFNDLSWQRKEVRQVGEVVTGTTPSTKNPEYYGGNYKLISPADLDNGKYVITAHRMLSALGLKQCRILPKNTVLVGCIGNVGKIGMVADQKAATNQQINAVICNSDHDPHFVYYSLFYNRQRLEKTAVKTTLPILNKSNFERFDLGVPLLPEQRRIAYILTTVQTAIEQQARMIALTRELKSALMHKLFTEGLRGEKQKESEIGLVPESWEVIKLQDACQLIVDCPHTTPNFQSSGVRVARNYNIRDGRFVFEHAFFTTEDEYKQRIKRAEPKPGDILFSREAPVGEACLIPQDMKISLGQRTMLIRTDSEKLDSAFMVYSFYSPNIRQRMLSMASGLTVAHLNVADVRSLAIQVPTILEQIEIGQYLNLVDERIEAAQKKKTLLEELFRTLLHQLMTGQVRTAD